jgi:hypothetical protein
MCERVQRAPTLARQRCHRLIVILRIEQVMLEDLEENINAYQCDKYHHTYYYYRRLMETANNFDKDRQPV